MPLFEYLCPNGHKFEHIVHHGEETPTHLQCEKCVAEKTFSVAQKVPSVWGRYRVLGDNSCSNTPKRWKGY